MWAKTYKDVQVSKGNRKSAAVLLNVEWTLHESKSSSLKASRNTAMARQHRNANISCGEQKYWNVKAWKKQTSSRPLLNLLVTIEAKGAKHIIGSASHSTLQEIQNPPVRKSKSSLNFVSLCRGQQNPVSKVLAQNSTKTQCSPAEMVCFWLDSMFKCQISFRVSKIQQQNSTQSSAWWTSFPSTQNDEFNF